MRSEDPHRVRIPASGPASCRCRRLCCEGELGPLLRERRHSTVVSVVRAANVITPEPLEPRKTDSTISTFYSGELKQANLVRKASKLNPIDVTSRQHELLPNSEAAQFPHPRRGSTCISIRKWSRLPTYMFSTPVVRPGELWVHAAQHHVPGSQSR
jgi:hypothetical protein